MDGEAEEAEGEVKAAEASIEYCAWCIKHASFLSRLAKKRGGWRKGDWYLYDNRKQLYVVTSPRLQFFKDGGTLTLVERVIWAPGLDDVVNLLEEMLLKLGEGDYGWALRNEPETGMYEAWVPGYHEGTGTKETYRTGFFPIPLIALIELLFIMIEVSE